MHLFFIVNPTAGRGKDSVQDTIEQIEIFCISKEIDYEIVRTAHRGHATLLAKKATMALVNYDAVVSVGGDGTLLEVANGLIGSNILLGILPTGTGNDFARSIGIPSNLNGALEFLISKKEKIIDVGILGSISFINVASVGLDAEIVQDIKRYKNIFKGRASYYIAALIKFFTYRFKTLTINIDGKEIKSKVLLVAIANGTYYGGGMKVNPKGLLEDGYLDIIIVNSLPRYKIPFLMLKFIKGHYQHLPYVDTYRCKRVSLKSKDNLIINTDGDILYSTPAEFSINPSSLKVIGK